MKKSKIMLIAIFAIMIVLLIAGCAQPVAPAPAPDPGPKTETPEEPAKPAEPAKEVVLKVGHVGSLESHYETTLQMLKADIEKKTDGRIKLDIYPNSQLGGERQLIESCQVGTIDMALASSTVLGTFAPEFNIIDLPFTFKDAEQAVKVLNEPEFAEALSPKALDVGIRVMYYGPAGIRNTYNSVRPITTLNDIKGMKIRVVENPIHIAMYEALGAKPTPMALPELFTAMEQGVVDGADNSVSFYYTLKHYEVCNYLALTNHVFTCTPLYFSEIRWQKLTPEDQALIQEAIQEVMLGDGLEVFLQLDIDALEAVKAGGSTVTQIEDYDKWHEALEDLKEKLLNEIPNGQKNWALLNKLIDEYEAKN